MPQKVSEIVTGLVSFDEALGVYLLLMEDRRFWVLHVDQSLHPLRGKRVRVRGTRAAEHILVVDEIGPA